MPAPPYPAVLDDLVVRLRQALDDELLGLYVYGSLVTGGFDPHASDIDLVVVTTTPASALDLDRLRSVHDEIAKIYPGWVDRIEVAYIGEATLRSFREGGVLAVISPGEPLHLIDGANRYLQNWYLVGLTSVTLSGPAREDIFPTISVDEFVAAVALYADEVRSRSVASMAPGMRAYTVLTMCRALQTISTRAPCSKQEGAATTRERHPEWGSLIDAALACRASGGRRGFDTAVFVAQVERFVSIIANDIAVRHRSAPPRIP